jgi:hypothetical protein
LIKGEEETVTADYWKRKFLDAQSAFQSLDDENNVLKKSILHASYPEDNYISQSMNNSQMFTTESIRGNHTNTF